MQTFISKLLAIEAVAKEIHWNGNGPGFVSVHRYLDEVIDSCRSHVDVVAEHMAAVKQYGLPQNVAEQHETFPQLFIAGRSYLDGLRILVPMLTDLVDYTEQALANESDDPAGEDILVAMLRDFNKHNWLLSAELP
jgi:starvation-inducible DNA-binding protein